ncbi:MAG: anti-sigma factor antagonist [Frankiaceae bacterium]|nr:anti-sigma factor antagonist [Frankiaceae bacterium]
MTVDMSIDVAGSVDSVYLADGKLVRLSGNFGLDELTALRLALLMPMSPDCRDVIVDAGEVTDVIDAVVAVLVAARHWAEGNGARFRMSRSAPSLDSALDALGMKDELPLLGPVQDAEPVRAQRGSGLRVPTQRRPRAHR